MAAWDAIVVGSGLGGLTCAAYLTVSGKRTLVLEQGKVAGGCSQVFRRAGNRFEFDVGVHYVGECGPNGVMTRALRGLGLDDRIEWQQLDPERHTTVVLPEVTVEVPSDWDAYIARMVEAFPSEARRLRACLGLLRRLGRETENGILAETHPKAMLAFLRRNPLTVTVGMLPIRRVLRWFRLSANARAVILAESGDYAAAPSRTAAVLHAGLMHHYLRQGAFYPAGGGQTIPANLIEVIESHGGAVRTKARVERILVEDGRVTGVRLLGGEVLTAPTVVSNGDLKKTLLDLVGAEHLSSATVARVSKYRMALPFFSVYLGLDMDLNQRLPNSTFWCFPDNDIEGMYAEGYAGRIPEQVAIFMTSATTKDPGSSGRAWPEGHSTLEVMALAPADRGYWLADGQEPTGPGYRRDSGYLDRKAELTEKVVDAAARVIPDLREHIVWLEASSPVTHERFTLSTGGACYGIELARDQFGPKRPGARTEIEGLFLAGASTVWGHGVVGAVTGGVGTAGCVLGRDLFAELRAGAVLADRSRLPEHPPGWDPLAESKPSSPLRPDVRSQVAAESGSTS